MPARTKLALLMGREEGFGKPGAIPTVRHNPGDLRHSPHSAHPKGKDDVGTIDTDAHGWEDLERQLNIYAIAGLTLKQAIFVFAPPGPPDYNNAAKYLSDIAKGLGVPDSTPMVDVLRIPAGVA